MLYFKSFDASQHNVAPAVAALLCQRHDARQYRRYRMSRGIGHRFVVQHVYRRRIYEGSGGERGFESITPHARGGIRPLRPNIISEYCHRKLFAPGGGYC
jgi:hypothetical protein